MEWYALDGGRVGVAGVLPAMVKFGFASDFGSEFQWERHGWSIPNINVGIVYIYTRKFPHRKNKLSLIWSGLKIEVYSNIVSKSFQEEMGVQGLPWISLFAVVFLVRSFLPCIKSTSSESQHSPPRMQTRLHKSRKKSVSREILLQGQTDLKRNYWLTEEHFIMPIEPFLLLLLSLGIDATELFFFDDGKRFWGM